MQHLQAIDWPHRCPIIGSPPEKSPPADNLPAKIRPASWQILSAGGDISGGSDPMMGRHFYKTGNKEETYKIRDYLSPCRFFIGKHFNVTPAVSNVHRPLTRVQRLTRARSRHKGHPPVRRSVRPSVAPVLPSHRTAAVCITPALRSSCHSPSPTHRFRFV